MAGRGSFIESFPLFGQDLDDYDELFAEKLELLLACARPSASRGPGATAPRSTTSASTPARSRTRSRSGSPSAGRRSPSSRAAAHGLPSRSRSSAAPRPLRAAARPLPRDRRPRRARPGPAAARRPPARLRGGHDRGGGRDLLRALRRGHDAARARARLAADVARPVRRDARAGGLARGRQPEEVTAKLAPRPRLLGLDRILLHLSVGTMPHAAVLRASSCSAPRSPPPCATPRPQRRRARRPSARRGPRSPPAAVATAPRARIRAGSPGAPGRLL